MELADALARRHMVRNFGPDPVDPAGLDRILAAGLRGPSAGHTQAVDLLVLVGATETARYWDTTLSAERRAGFRWPGLLIAPVLVLPCVSAAAYVARYAEPDKARTGLGEGADSWAVPYWHVDGGMAVMAMLLTIVDEGLGALFFGLFEHEAAVRDEFGIPSDRQPLGALAIGHAAATDQPGRSAERDRRRPADVVHRGQW